MGDGICRGCGLWRDRRGLTAMEYAIMGGVIAAAVAYGMTLETQGVAEAWRVIMSAFPSNAAPSDGGG